MTAQYVEDFFTNTFTHTFIPLFITCGVVYFVILAFRKGSSL
jgi:hypothetical protein